MSKINARMAKTLFLWFGQEKSMLSVIARSAVRKAIQPRRLTFDMRAQQCGTVLSAVWMTVVGASTSTATSAAVGTCVSASSSSSSSATAECLPPEMKQRYSVLNNTQVSPDSNILTVGFDGREFLGWEKNIPTCISVTYEGKDVDEEPTEEKKPLAKSYSPISHPSQKGTFELLVKSYPYQPGGGVGKYLCGLKAGDSFEAKVKSQRIMHSSAEVLGRWSHVGLIAGGTGIAPLFQILQILLGEERTKISILSINRFEHDILLKAEMDELAKKHPDRIKVTYSLTGENKEGYASGRGSVDMALEALPKPSEDNTMVFVCGRDEFVEIWGGKVCREKTTDGSKGKKIQGPLLGILRDAGYDASQVFKY